MLMAVVFARQNLKLNLVPGGSLPVLHASQYDSGYDVHFTLYSGGSIFEIPDDVSIRFEMTKRDNFGYSTGVEKSNLIGQCYLWMQEQMTAVTGNQTCELVLTNTAGRRIGTANFILCVERAALDKDTVISQSQINYANQVLNKLGTVDAYKEQLDAQGAKVAQVASDLATEVSARSDTDASLQSQINQLVAPTGEAPSAAEVQNARVGANGTTYTTLGDAIRGQVTDTNNRVGTVEKTVFSVPASYPGIVSADGWTLGSGVRPSDGVTQTTAKQCRTNYNTIKGNTLLYIDSADYDFVVWEYSDASVSTAVYAPRKAWGSDPVIITTGYGAKYFRIGVKRKDNADMTATDVTTLTTAVKTSLMVDNTLTIADAAADAKKAGDEITSLKTRTDSLETFQSEADAALAGTRASFADASVWEIGSFISADGQQYPSTAGNRMRTKSRIPHVCGAKTEAPYIIAAFAWQEDGTYVGTLQEDGTYAKTSAYFARTLAIDPSAGYVFRFLLKKDDDTVLDEASDGGHVTIYTSVPMANKADIEELKPLQSYIPQVFPADGKKADALSFYASFDALANWQEVTDGQLYEYGYVDGGYVDSHITDYQNYPLRAYYLNGRMEYIGHDGGSNYYALLSPYTDDPHAQATGTSLYQRKKVLITAGMHGDEGATPNVLREFVRNLIHNPGYADILAGYEFCFIPLCNPYGYSIDRRDCRYYDPDAGQIVTKDMNRDFAQDGTEQVLNEAKFLKQIFLEGEYDLVIDLHQHNFDVSEGSTSYRLAFGGVTLNAESQLHAADYYRMISGQAIYAQNEIVSMYDIEDTSQTMFAWDRGTTHTDTFREWAVGTRDTSSRHKAEMAAVSETSTTCYVYSGTHTKYNQLAMTVCNIFDDAFLTGILRKYIE